VIASPADLYCAYCGLPIGGARGARADEIDYCCSGCRVTAAVEAAPIAEEAVRNLLIRIGLAIFFTMNVVVFTMELWSRDVYTDPSYETAFAVHLRGVFQWASLLFAAPVLFILGGPLVAGVRQSIARRAATTDLLILLGVAASYLYSAVSVVRGDGQIYFEVGCVVLVFVSIGRWLESRGKHRTGAALDALTRLLPAEVRRAKSSDAALREDRETELVSRDEIRVADFVRVLPGERVPVDGRISAGRAMLDEHIATGESRPVAKGIGDPIYSGALNLDGDLWINVTAAAGSDLVSRLMQLVRDARKSKGRHERLADRIAAWFTPAVCMIAIAAGCWHGWRGGVDQGILVGLAVVLIACPCALGLATPMAIWTALGRAADHQVLFRSGAVLERLAGVRSVCFDKTGTLTCGEPQVRDVYIAAGSDRAEVLAVSRRLASGSTHGLSRAIVRFADRAMDNSWSNDRMSRIASLLTRSGRGVEAVDERYVVVARLGSSRWMVEVGDTMPGDLNDVLAASDSAQAPLACVAWDGVVQGVFLFSEQMRPEAADAVSACRDLGLRTMVLTGDQRGHALVVARELGIEAVADQLPEEKVASLSRLSGPVAMVGDGLNDAPALAAADVGIALGCGADLSREAAGVCLLGDQLDRLPWSIGLARETMRVVRQNLFWTFAYNIAGIALAVMGRLNPIWAALAMGLSSVIVVGNSLRLSRYGEADVVRKNETLTSATEPTAARDRGTRNGDRAIKPGLPFPSPERLAGASA
jgi:heavy metal translocating P-type ATPase